MPGLHDFEGSTLLHALSQNYAAADAAPERVNFAYERVEWLEKRR